MTLKSFVCFLWLSVLLVGDSSAQTRPPTAKELSLNDPFNRRDSNSIIIEEPTYFIVASRVVRPSQIYRVAVSILTSPISLSVRASILRNGVDIGSATQECKPGIPETLLIKIPSTTVPGQYRLRVEGNTDRALGGTAFLNETLLHFSQRSMTIFIQTEKPVYHQTQTVRFRTIPINTELRAFDDAVDVYMIDPKGFVVRRWLSRQSNFGAVSLDYALSDQPTYGKWTIRVAAQGQLEEEHFYVEEYYQTRFEVNVTMAAFYFDSDRYIRGSVMANYTSGAPVKGNLTLKATFRPIKRDRSYRPDNVVERNLTFTEVLGGWFTQGTHEGSEVLNNFDGVYEFKYPMVELQRMVPKLDGMELRITAIIGDRYRGEYVEGFSTARIFNSSLNLKFMGANPQVIKPSMPFTCFLAVSFHDGSSLPLDRLNYDRMEIRPTVEFRSSSARTLNVKVAKASADHPGIWQLTIDLAAELVAVQGGKTSDKRIKNLVNEISLLRLTANYKDGHGEKASAELLAQTHFSHGDKHIKVLSSTHQPRVGEYIVMHVRTNFYVESFDYIILSKGTVLLTGTQLSSQTVTTFSVTLSAEMAPEATVVVYHVAKYGKVVADSLTFPVNGISRNNFTLTLNPLKDKTGDTIEVVVLGDPGSYVGISAIDKGFFNMQAGNELSYAEVIQKMSLFNQERSGALHHVWTSREGNADTVVNFPASTLGIDANRTFEFAGLVVFTDANVIRRPDNCNASMGFSACMSGACYRTKRRCDAIYDCQDRSDESGCPDTQRQDLMNYRLTRINRLLRMYENSWLWKDINIGPHGQFIFNVLIPQIPTHWMVSAFSVSPKFGFGLVKKPQELAGFRPFYMNVEMPSVCRQGEQIGIRITLFNYMTQEADILVTLANSPHYKFVHVGELGQVSSYDAKTSFGERQHLTWIPAQGAQVVYIPVVPTKLGDIDVTIQAKSLVRKEQVTRRVRVEADGIPQYRHTSVMLDLSNRAWFLQYAYVNVTETPIIPYGQDRYYVFGSNRARVSVVGDVVGPAFATMPVNATSMLHLPMDCAEQNMFSFASNLYTIKYMRLTTQRKRDIDRNAFHHMNTAYQRQLSFQHQDGAFSYFRSDWDISSKSVWLTAFCARILAEANFNEWENYLYIDPTVIARAVNWMIQFQSPEGAFYEVAHFADRKMNSSTSWPNDPIRYRNVSLTAHVVIALTTIRDLPGELGPRVAVARSKALSWLDRNINLLQKHGDPYEVAITAYAMMLAKSTSAETAFVLLRKHAREEGGFVYWSREPVPLPAQRLENQRPFLLPRLPHSFDATNVETTAYALLTYVGRQELFVEPIVKWLNTQRLTDAGWASTQDTIVATQALIEYTVRHRIREVTSLTLHMEATSNPKLQRTIYINEDNLATPQFMDIPDAWGTVKVQARGAGYAIMQLSLQYNVDVERFMTPPPVRAFDLTPRLSFSGRNSSHITYDICQRWINTRESNTSGMAVLDVAVPTGYFMQQQDLDDYVLSRQVRNLRLAKFLDAKVVFYFDRLDAEETCVHFTFERWYPVANMTRYLPVRVYDYYAPERFNESIVEFYELYVLDICQVCGSYQCTYCPTYNHAAGLSSSLIITSFISILLLTLNFINK